MIPQYYRNGILFQGTALKWHSFIREMAFFFLHPFKGNSILLSRKWHVFKGNGILLSKKWPHFIKKWHAFQGNSIFL
jgi:hypothetical protein